MKKTKQKKTKGFKVSYQGVRQLDSFDDVKEQKKMERLEKENPLMYPIEVVSRNGVEYIMISTKDFIYVANDGDNIIFKRNYGEVNNGIPVANASIGDPF